MNDDNVVTERASTRCFACKLPAELLDVMHADRFERGMGFEVLARKYALPDRPLSESGCRRHFARHVVEPEDSRISNTADLPGGDGAAGDTERSDGLDGHAVLEASTKALTEMMDSLVREYRAIVGRNPREAERLLGLFMKVQGQLQRSLKARDEGRVRQLEFRQTVPQIVQRCTTQLVRSILPVMRENAAKLRDEVVEYSKGQLSAEDFWNHLVLYEIEWPKEVGLRLRAATTEVLKMEESKAAVED